MGKEVEMEAGGAFQFCSVAPGRGEEEEEDRRADFVSKEVSGSSRIVSLSTFRSLFPFL